MNKNVEDQFSSVTNLRSLLTDGVLIALATAFVYLATFVYELGYCVHFGIPFSLISLNTSTILVAAAAIGSTFISMANLLGFTTPLFRKSKKLDGSSFWGFLGITLVAVIFFAKAYDLSWKNIAYILGGLLAIAAAIFLLALFTAIIFSFVEKFRKPKISTVVSKDSSEEFSIMPDDFLRNWLPPKFVRVIFFLGGALLAAYSIGNGNATTQNKFLLLKDTPNFAVLRIYGDLLILASFEKASKEVSNELSLIWISEKKQIGFINQEVGPLKLKK